MLYNQNWNIPANPVRETLLRAADLMEQHGYARGIRLSKSGLYGNKVGSMCFLGAVNAAQGDAEGLDTELTKDCSIAFCEAVGVEYGSIYPTHTAANWNNTHEGPEVIKAMRLAAELVVAKEKVDAV